MKLVIMLVVWYSTLVYGKTFAYFKPVISQQWNKNDTRKRINEEARLGIWHTIELPLDHFDVLDNRTYRARYITNDQFYKKGGPIIVYIGGEWEIEEYGVMGGVAFQLARQHNGYLFYPEHRYFGKSLPFSQPVSVENLRYITPDYSLADLAYSITHIKDTVDGLKESQVLVIGGSYAGALAVWGRLKYPHIIDMAYACGGVTKSDTFNKAYYEVLHRSMKQINPQCLDLIKSGIAEVSRLQVTDEGKAKLYALAPTLICPGNNPFFRMAQFILNEFNAQVWPVYKTAQVCHYLMTNTTGFPLERLVQMISIVSDDSKSRCDVETEHEWFYLVCAFFGNIQITSKSNFGNLATAERRLQRACIDNYGPRFNKEFVDQHTRRTTILYGGATPDVTKVLSVQGTHDPWFTHAVLDDLNDETPVVYIKDANHCLEIGEEQDDETPQVSQSKIEILEQLAKWIR